MQPVFNEHKAVAYLSQYFSKTEDKCSHTMKQVAKENFENNFHHHDTMQIIAKAYLNNRESSVQEVVYRILSELRIPKKNFSGCSFC